ncbi:MAG: hypothetical protein O2820_02210 [Planctomycetota bacterium]|nr:hypothetical protein [Planctomycetota bacterium]MDA1248013.1 hypothetical protein [Planctomycetota bacterium]
MTVRLCQACCQWVWTKNERCPGCDDAVSEYIDPVDVARQVRSTVGEVVGKIGHVRIHRKRLPADGILYETQNGLFFLPHRNVTVKRLVEENSSSPFWTIAGILWSPLIFLLPFLKKQRLRETDVQESQPVRLTGTDLQLLPDLLPRMPGALFISVGDIQKIRLKGQRWVIRRFAGGETTIEALAAEPFRVRMEGLLSSDSWRMVSDWQ